MTELVHVGAHADILASGRHVGPGDRIDSDVLDLEGGDQHLLDEGRIVEVSSFGAAGNQLSREELGKRAAELEIEGRSKMTVDELRAAVAAEEAGHAA